MPVINDNNISCSLVSPPTYLKEFGVEEQNILLTYSKGDPEKESLTLATGIESFKIEKNDSLDLTGSPLEVDLNGDETFLTSGSPNHLHLWTGEEEFKYPVDIKKARQIINEQFKVKKCEGDYSSPIYVVCDGDNTENTVLLGGQRTDKFIMSTKVNILGCLPTDHNIFSTDEMIKNHIDNTRLKDSKIKYRTKSRYYLYGDFIQNTKYMNDLEMYGSISIQTTCNTKCSFNTLQNMSRNNSIKVQVICGHPHSQVYFLWEELCVLQTYIDILIHSDKYSNPDTVLSQDPLNISKISRELTDAIGTTFLQKKEKNNFSLATIRPQNLMDKLWNILKRCKYLSDLRDCFHFLFEELTDSDTIVKLPDTDSTNIAAIINGILKGVMSVPTVTYSQALQFLFELGTEKLKNDYLAILKIFFSKSNTTISLKWSKFESKLNLQNIRRKTRITLHTNPNVEILNHNVPKLAYLGNMHISTEFIYLLKTEAEFPDELFDDICKQIYRIYIDEELIQSDFSELQNVRLRNFETIVDVPERKIIKNELPRSWCMKMTSLNNDMEVTTVYHLSYHPIFPLTVYNNYDIANRATDVDHFYVSILERYKEIM